MPLSIFPRRSFRDAESHRFNDLVVFYKYAYDFWYYKGKWNAMVARLVDLANACVLWILVWVFGLMFDWDKALACDGEACTHVQLIHSPQLPTTHSITAFVFVVACTAVVAWELKRVVEGYFLFQEIHEYMNHLLDCSVSASPFRGYYLQYRRWRFERDGHSLLVDDDEEEGPGPRSSTTNNGGTAAININMMDGAEAAGSGSGPRGVRPCLDDISWPDFLHLFSKKVRSDRGLTNSRTMDELKIVQVMMLIENFQVALHHHNILAQAPLCFADENMITFLVEAQMGDYRIAQDSDAVKRFKGKLFVWTLLYVLAYPFIVSFMLTKLAVKTIAELRTNPGQMMDRSWSVTANWRFRLYNEVPHVASARIRKGNEVANTILRRSAAAEESPISRVLQRTAASILVIFVVATFINTSLLNYGYVFDRTLVWWLSMAALIFGACAGAEVYDREYDHTQDINELVSHLHYDRPKWYRSPAAFSKDVVKVLLPRKMWALMVSFGTVVFAPIVLLWLYRSDALLQLISFMHDPRNHKDIDGVGSMCTPSRFQFNLTGGSGTLGSFEGDDLINTSASAEDLSSPPREMEERRGEGAAAAATEEGIHLRVGATPAAGGEGVTSFEWKVEKSVVSFACIYPRWLEQYKEGGDPLGVVGLIDRLDDCITDEAAAEGLEASRRCVNRGKDAAAQLPPPPSGAAVAPTGSGTGSHPLVPPLNFNRPTTEKLGSMTPRPGTGGRPGVGVDSHNPNPFVANAPPSQLYMSGTVHDREALNVCVVDALQRASRSQQFVATAGADRRTAGSTQGAGAQQPPSASGGISSGGLSATSKVGSYGGA